MSKSHLIYAKSINLKAKILKWSENNKILTFKSVISMKMSDFRVVSPEDIKENDTCIIHSKQHESFVNLDWLYKDFKYPMPGDSIFPAARIYHFNLVFKLNIDHPIFAYPGQFMTFWQSPIEVSHYITKSADSSANLTAINDQSACLRSSVPACHISYVINWFPGKFLCNYAILEYVNQVCQLFKVPIFDPKKYKFKVK